MKKRIILICLLGLFIFSLLFVNKNKFVDGNVLFTDDSVTSLAIFNIVPISDTLGKRISANDDGFLSFSVFSSSNKEIKYEI